MLSLIGFEREREWTRPTSPSRIKSRLISNSGGLGDDREFGCYGAAHLLFGNSLPSGHAIDDHGDRTVVDQ